MQFSQMGGKGGEGEEVENNTLISLLAFLQILIKDMAALLITEKEKKILMVLTKYTYITKES